MNPALSQEFNLFCEQEHPQRHANTDKNPYCVYGTLELFFVCIPRLDSPMRTPGQGRGVKDSKERYRRSPNRVKRNKASSGTVNTTRSHSKQPSPSDTEYEIARVRADA